MRDSAITSREASAGSPVVNLIACGAMVPEALEAADRLLEEGVYTNVINVTGPGPLYRHYRESTRRAVEQGISLAQNIGRLIPGALPGAPVVTVADAHPHSLAWLGSALGSKAIQLGVDDWGQSGNRDDLYKEYKTDAESIVAACITVLDD